MAIWRNGIQRGFTLIELMVATAIIGLLAAIALGQYRDYVRGARLVDALLALGHCKSAITEGYLARHQAPAAGHWGCELQAPPSRVVSAVETSADGVIRLTLANLDSAMDGHFIHLVPLKPDGVTALRAPADLGSSVRKWSCGSDFAPLRKALPSSCRADTSAHAGASFE